jgi:hypothetical protein
MGVIAMSARHIVAIIVLVAVCPPLGAQGLFDFLDPCIAAKQDFWQSRAEIMNSLARENEAVTSEKATPQFRDFWWEEKKKLLQRYFDDNLGDVVRAGGGNAQKAFEVWLALQIKKQGGMNAVDPIIQSEYKKTKRLALEQQKGVIQVKLDESKNNLYKSCPQDVGNQVFRGAITILSAPVNIVQGNFDGASRESGDIAKLLRIITGVSVTDIQSRGVCGGDNSEMRKLFGSLC